MKSLKQVVFRIVTSLTWFILLIAGFVSADGILYLRVRPPADLKTIQGFEAWKKGAVVRKGTYENAGKTYIVILSGTGRALASGPAAYLFDQSGNFVDWTVDKGDFCTVKKRFDLTKGVKDLRSENY